MADVIQIRARMNQLKQARLAQSNGKTVGVNVSQELVEAIVADLDELSFIVNEHNRAIKLLMDAVTALSLQSKSESARQLVLDIANRTISTRPIDPSSGT
jgi:hypothetical protein